MKNLKHILEIRGKVINSLTLQQHIKNWLKNQIFFKFFKQEIDIVVIAVDIFG